MTMKPWTFGLALTLAAGCSTAALAAATECVESPGKALKVCVTVDGGQATYEASRNGEVILQRAPLGLVFGGETAAKVSVAHPAERRSHDETWEQPWGEQRLVRDRHNELRVHLAGDTPNTRTFDVIVRVFDDGLGFRYDFNAIPAGRDVTVTDELTEFRPAGKLKAWWFESRQKERDEYLYRSGSLDEIKIAETPFTLERDGLYLTIHEAALVDYASMTLKRTGANTFKADLMPWSDGVLVRRTGAFQTPWRTVLVGKTPGELADSRLELNLNEPSKIADVSWIKPLKYVGVWWEMHLNKSTWGSGPTHGANTANVKRYIDFAAKYGFDGVLVEGWNTGWDGDWIANGDKFSFTQAYPDFDLAAVTAYGKSKGVQLIGHNETAGALANYESQMDAGFAQYEAHGVHAVKTGYVKDNGKIERKDEAGKVVGDEWFAGQYKVRHELKVVEHAARHRIAIDAHEAVKDTGLRRTWPNWVSRESARGQEFNAWGNPTNPPEHVTIIPFTRMLAGPMDFTPGIFDIEHGKTEVDKRVQSTLANQLALYVVLYSPVQMAADLPETYEKYLDAFQFIRDVPVDWEQSRTLDARIGDYVMVARQRRKGQDWYLGAVTDETARSLDARLDFLAPGRRYEAKIYRDAPGADYRTNPRAYEIVTRTVTSADSLKLDLAPGGGAAVSFKAIP
jgi:alpha-glucosidase